MSESMLNINKAITAIFGKPGLQQAFISNWQIKTHCGVTWLSCSFDNNYFTPDLFTLFALDYPGSLHAAVSKRKSEFLAGRVLAKLGLSLLEAETGEVPVGKNRNPIWPAGYLGSISHTDSEAHCMVAATDKIQLIGLDIETLMSPKLAEETYGVIIDSTESALLKQLDISFRLGLTLVFSAKETIFKALYPAVQKYFDFLDVALVSFNDAQLHFVVKKDLCGQYPKGTDLACRYEAGADSVVTYLIQ